MSGQYCVFTNYSVWCESSCCTEVCCGASNSEDDDELVAIIITCAVGLLCLLLLIFLVYAAATEIYKLYLAWLARRAARNRKDSVESKPQSAFAISTQTSKRIPDDGSNDKMTQTLHHKNHHSDTLLVSRMFFLPAEQTTDEYRDYVKDLRDYHVAEVGTCTSGKDPMHKVRRKWNSTANYYTRRDSLKGSSEDDDTLEPEKVAHGVAREKVNVGAEEKMRNKNANNWQKYAAQGWQPQVTRDRAAAVFASLGKLERQTPPLSTEELKPSSASSRKSGSLSPRSDPSIGNDARPSPKVSLSTPNSVQQSKTPQLSTPGKDETTKEPKDPTRDTHIMTEL